MNETIKKLKEVISNLPLSPRAIDIYIYLLKQKKASVQDIAKNLKIDRVSTYKLTEELIEQGLIRRESSRFGAKLLASHPLKLDLLAEEQVSKTTIVSKEIKELLPELLSLQKNNPEETTLHFLEGKEGVTKMYDDITNVFKNDPTLDRENELIAFTNTNLILKTVPKGWADGYRRRKFELKLRGKYLVPHDDNWKKYVEDNYEKHGMNVYTKYRNLPQSNLKIETEISAYANKVSFISLVEKNPCGIIIENKTLANTLKCIFSIMWEQTEKNENKKTSV